MKRRRLYTIYDKACFLKRLRDGRRVFVKASHSSQSERRAMQRLAIEREKACLGILRGLAVPELRKLPPSELPRTLIGKAGSYIAESAAGDMPFHDLGLGREDLLGAWLFFVEQLVAFRRSRVIYADIKCANIMAQKKPLRAWLVDFGCAVPLRGQRHLKGIGFTPAFEAPEVARGLRPTERSLVYELGMLLAHLLTGLDNSSLHHKRRGLRRTSQLLGRMASPEMTRLIRDCLSADPGRRPKNYEAVLRRIENSRVPERSLRLWKRLRAPCAKRLTQLGLVLA